MEMAEMYREVVDLLRRPAVAETVLDVLLCAVPIWVAVMIGLVIGWSWRPRWTGLVFLGLRSRCRFLWTAPPGFGARRLWFAFTALSAFSVCSRLWSHFKGKASAAEAGAGPLASAPGSDSAAAEGGGFSFSHLLTHFKGKGFSTDDMSSATTTMRSTTTPPSIFTMEEGDGTNFRSEPFEREQDIVSEKDLEHLLQLLDGKVGEAGWQHQMERKTPNVFYQAWRHDPEVGPTIYRSRTVFEDATPELLRDFFWDDDFRLKWDAMLGYYKTLEEFPQTGTMIVHWIKKFPFFCSDREYIIGRRIWESGKSYYCVTKAVPYPALPKKEKPRRVELYFSSWSIKAVESRKQDGQLSACEVVLVHYEDMGLPKDVANVGIRHGMWGAVKKLHSGMRAYQHSRKAENSLSRCALMARITTRIPSHGALNLLNSESSDVDASNTNPGVDWKWVVIGGTLAVVCGLQTGIIGKALLVGAARRLARK